MSTSTDQQDNWSPTRPQINNTQQILGYTLDPNDLILYFLAFFAPPLPILVRKGLNSKAFAIGIFLWLFFHFPGTVYALYIVYETSIITGTEEGIESRVHWSLNNNNPDYQPLDEENQVDDNDDASLAKHGVYGIPDDEPPSYQESSSSTTVEDAARAEAKTFNDNKIQH